MPSSECVDPPCLEYSGGGREQRKGDQWENWSSSAQVAMRAWTRTERRDGATACKLPFDGTLVRDSPSDTESSQHPLCSRFLDYARDVTCMLATWKVPGKVWGGNWGRGRDRKCTSKCSVTSAGWRHKQRCKWGWELHRGMYVWLWCARFLPFASPNPLPHSSTLLSAQVSRRLTCMDKDFLVLGFCISEGRGRVRAEYWFPSLSGG